MSKLLIAFIWLVFVMSCVVWLFGCTTYRATLGDAQVDMTYVLQDKTFKSFSYDPNTHMIIIENFGSETSQIVESAISAAIGGRL